jgi:osmotically inducible protein OsmC
MQRSASAQWQGGLTSGKGTLSTESGVLSYNPYSFSTRFEHGNGTNPEELLAAAHAGCFTMALSAQLEKAGSQAEQLNTTATVTLEKVEANWTVTSIHLDVRGKIPRGDQATWNKATAAAKSSCPISRLINTIITMEATLDV